MTIECRFDGIADVLEELYGPSKTGALARSALAAEAPTAAGSIRYAAVTQGLLVMAEYVGTKKLVLYIEPIGGLLRHGAETICDQRANDILASASLGVRGKILAGDAAAPVLTGVVTGAVLLVALLVGNASADFVYGSATAVAVALLYVASILRALSSKAISWR